MDEVVFITTVRPGLLVWVLAISLFISLAATAIISTGRKWFELAVIFSLCFLINVGLVGLVINLVSDTDVVVIEAIEAMEAAGL